MGGFAVGERCKQVGGGAGEKGGMRRLMRGGYAKRAKLEIAVGGVM